MDVSELSSKGNTFEQQTPLEQDLISICCKICPRKQNFSFKKQDSHLLLLWLPFPIVKFCK